MEVFLTLFSLVMERVALRYRPHLVLSLSGAGRARSSVAPLPVLPLSRVKNTDDDDDTQYVR